MESSNMLQCGLCEARFSSSDALRVHLEGHASQLFDSDEEVEQNEIKCELESDEESVDFEYVKEEEQLQGQQENTQADGPEESTSLAPSEAAENGLTLLAHCSTDDQKEHHASQLFDSDKKFHENEIKTEQGFDQDSDEGSLIFDYAKEEEGLHGQQEATQGEVGLGWWESDWHCDTRMCLLCPQGEVNSEESSSWVPSEVVERTVHERESSSETFMCSKCSYKFTSKRKFNVHMNVMHLNEYKCDHCTKSYPTKRRLADHVQDKHEEVDKPKLPEDEFYRMTKKKQEGNRKKVLYECLKCTFKTPKRSVIYRHIRGVHRKRLDELYKSKGMVLGDAGYHKCTECFFKTLTRLRLRRHFKAVHVCDLCKKAFSSKEHLQHMKYGRFW